MNNTVMKDAVEATHAFTSDEAMCCQYMLRENSSAEIGDCLQQSSKTWVQLVVFFIFIMYNTMW